ncbi:MAG: UDP-galactopyranose mutase [Bacteroidetes bacterium]|nr:UDP-galactopyranose mutase [Bacteroidota bacterium]
MYDWLVVGCGFTGATLAERIATQLGERVLIIDKRGHIGGNAYDYLDESGIRLSKYGAHIFHTYSEKVWNYVNQFADFNDYIHRVDAWVSGRYFAMPLNLETVNSFFDTNLTSESLQQFLYKKRVPIEYPKNAEEAVLSKVGWELYDAFYRSYTKKQWGIDARDLDASVTLRLPIRMDSDKRYFSDPWQGIPVNGYTSLFERMLRHKNIDLLLDANYREIASLVKFKRMIYTGNIDSFFDFEHGKLSYRSLKFEHMGYDTEYFQHVGVVNYPNDFDFTRIVEHKHLYKQRHEKTAVSREYPCWNEEEPYYPIPSTQSQQLYRKYEEAANKLRNVYFCGRLGTYRYYNMDQCVAQALHLFETQVSKREKVTVVG